MRDKQEAKLNLACTLANVIDTWTVGALVSYSCERISSEEIWNWTVDELRCFVYDNYVDELMGLSERELDKLNSNFPSDVDNASYVISNMGAKEYTENE